MSPPATIAAGVRLVVVGDVMLDEYIFGEATRISPEAPVPVVHALGERRTPGGAAHSHEGKWPAPGVRLTPKQ